MTERVAGTRPLPRTWTACPPISARCCSTSRPQGELAWQVFGGTLRYAAGLVPEIADDVVNIDHAIRWGFNWGARDRSRLLDTTRAASGASSNRIRAEGAELPAMLLVLDAAGASGFYRTGPADQRQYLTSTGDWRPIPA